MNLSLNVIIGVVCLLIGIYLGTKVSNKPDAVVTPQVAQDQSQKCKAVVSKVTAPDGTVTESTSFTADSNQSQEIKPLASLPVFKHSLIILKDQVSYSYKYIKTNLFELSPLIQYRFENSVHGGVKIDF